MGNILSKDAMYGDIEELSNVYGGLKDYTKYIITSDTDSIFVVLQDFVDKEDLNEVGKICGGIENFLNNKIVLGVVKKHQVNVDVNKLRLKNELVCKRGVFISKKHYALNIVKREEKLVNEIKIVGIETQRSDYPALTKQYLKVLLDMMLSSDSISIVEILDFIDVKEKEFIQKIKAGDKEVARPSSFGKKLTEYKKIPQNVVSMLNWNDLMYNYFLPGTKGYLFKLLGLDKDIAPKDVVEKYYKNFETKNRKLETISIPENESNLPKWFIPDIKAMVKFSWIDRYTQLTEPLTSTKTQEYTWDDE